LSDASIETLVRAAKSGDLRAVEQLVLGDGPLRRVVEGIKRDAILGKRHRRTQNTPDEHKLEEAEAAARLGILEALKRFDPARGASFTTFAYNFIKGEVLSALYAKVRRSDDQRPVVQLVPLMSDESAEPAAHPRFESDLLKNDPGYGAESGYGQLIKLEEYLAVRRFVETLPDSQRVIVGEVYFEGRSHKDLAIERGVSPQAISKTVGKALARGRASLDPTQVAA
jgi:RNA polymerase sigma factor (sigma-70 family)